MSGKIEPFISPELLEDEELEDEELLELEDELLELADELLALDEALELLEEELALLEPVLGAVEPPQADKMADTEATASQRDQPGKAMKECVLILSPWFVNGFLGATN